MFCRSIRWRLQLWYGILFVTLLTGFGVTAYQLERARQLRQIDDTLRERLSVVLRELRAPGSRDEPPGPRGDRRPPPPPLGGDEPRDRGAGPTDFRLSSRSAGLFDSSDEAGFYYVLWRRDGVLLSRSTNAPADSLLPERGSSAVQKRTRGHIREVFQFTPPGECVLAGRSTAREAADLRRLAWLLSGVGVGVLLIGLAVGWWLASRAIRPIDEISATAVQISAGDLSRRIRSADTENELGRLAGVLNSTFARLDAAFAQQSSFTADAAHELRTPVSVVLTQTQTALNRDRTAPEYREALQACQRAAQRMRGLIESLLELARIDAGQEPMKRMRFDLATVAAECIDLVRPLAQEREITLHVDAASAECNGDPERIAQVVTNLLGNAIQYNREKGEVRIATRVENGLAVLTVSDTGQGIDAEDLPHIFERFYRADKSRARSNGRTGLGLAICKAIVEAHGGAIEVASEPGDGSTFTVRLPG